MINSRTSFNMKGSLVGKISSDITLHHYRDTPSDEERAINRQIEWRNNPESDSTLLHPFERGMYWLQNAQGDRFYLQANAGTAPTIPIDHTFINNRVAKRAVIAKRERVKTEKVVYKDDEGNYQQFPGDVQLEVDVSIRSMIAGRTRVRDPEAYLRYMVIYDEKVMGASQEDPDKMVEVEVPGVSSKMAISNIENVMAQPVTEGWTVMVMKIGGVAFTATYSGAKIASKWGSTYVHQTLHRILFENDLISGNLFSGELVPGTSPAPMQIKKKDSRISEFRSRGLIETTIYPIDSRLFDKNTPSSPFVHVFSVMTPANITNSRVNSVDHPVAVYLGLIPLWDYKNPPEFFVSNGLVDGNSREHPLGDFNLRAVETMSWGKIETNATMLRVAEESMFGENVTICLDGGLGMYTKSDEEEGGKSLVNTNSNFFPGEGVKIFTSYPDPIYDDTISDYLMNDPTKLIVPPKPTDIIYRNSLIVHGSGWIRAVIRASQPNDQIVIAMMLGSPDLVSQHLMMSRELFLELRDSINTTPQILLPRFDTTDRLTLEELFEGDDQSVVNYINYVVTITVFLMPKYHQQDLISKFGSVAKLAKSISHNARLYLNDIDAVRAGRDIQSRKYVVHEDTDDEDHRGPDQKQQQRKHVSFVESGLRHNPQTLSDVVRYLATDSRFRHLYTFYSGSTVVAERHSTLGASNKKLEHIRRKEEKPSRFRPRRSNESAYVPTSTRSRGSRR